MVRAYLIQERETLELPKRTHYLWRRLATRKGFQHPKGPRDSTNQVAVSKILMPDSSRYGLLVPHLPKKSIVETQSPV